MNDLKFDVNGLIPAIVQDARTNRVLMVAYMNEESLAVTLAEGRTCFYSRSRQELWRKGETSGNIQRVVRVTADCDRDALLIAVIPEGPACHTGAESCFFNPIKEEISGEISSWRDMSQFAPEPEGEPEFSLPALFDLVKGRKEQPQEGSYTTYLFGKGKEKILKKVGEECTEVVIGAMKDSRSETVYEIADLCYHVLVLMAEMGISLNEVTEELASRHVVDKKTKQETMQ